ncbi:MAG: orotidine-5'-phosphate decarboxylase [Candidatus Berkelbacteria bacterium Licking1014_7]|uniref:Orotidine 5'-phosphate decarboxylase n=1 Tax=Candidatus Berkelbacteria bacterium Licking1014_7 TaxID=2017147 RepID=A0A554LJB2_9BACT|nr:MAG: orotidine-5'-phosphate decarboxylase [Candidatus Berkelbacteria bacterium Licking1014_7]
MKPLLFVALDDLANKEGKTLKVAEQLSGVEGNFGFKINLDYLLNPEKGSKALLRPIQQFGRLVFSDLKMWNGTRTMASVIENLVALGVDYLNVYALADELLPKAIQNTEGTKTKVLGLTVLTHYNEAYCQKHFRRSLPETVRHFAEVAVKAGCHGIILPGTALEAVADLDTIKVVPGVRPTWHKDTRHEEEVEPRVAAEKGANVLVCGSPIMKSENPAEALRRILAEIQ